MSHSEFRWDSSAEADLFRSLKGAVNKRDGAFTSPQQAAFIRRASYTWAAVENAAHEAEVEDHSIRSRADAEVTLDEARQDAHRFFGVPVGATEHLVYCAGTLVFEGGHGQLTGHNARRVAHAFVVDAHGVARHYKVRYHHAPGGSSAPNPERTELLWQRPANFSGEALLDQYDAAQAKKRQQRDAAEAAAEVAPAGRVRVTGEVVSVKTVDGPYGSQRKMLVRDERGFKVFTTVPSSHRGCNVDQGIQPGDRVSLTVTLEPAVDDPKFAIGKRPTKMKRD